MSEGETPLPSEEAVERLQDEERQTSPRDWHRVLSGFLCDWLTKQPIHVQAEYNLSLQEQFLDVLMVREDAQPLTVGMPDGFEELRKHNLITFKSLHEPLTGDALDEMVSHFVTYRKIVSKRGRKKLPRKYFRLFALTVRFPRKLAKNVKLKELSQGVYRVRTFSGKAIRIVVINRLPLQPHNAALLLFSTKEDALAYAIQHYPRQSDMSSSLLAQLLAMYTKENIVMPFDINKWIEEKELERIRAGVAKLKPEERVEGLKPEERIAGLKPEERIAGLKPEERIAGLKPEERVAGLKPEERVAGLKPEERLAGMSSDELEVLQRLIDAKRSGANP